ncbi:MAG TPA: dihydrolipoamide acetyltransferase family protein [Vicinamibacterales bacterium]|jgi:2-oxoglutarate dehydrogenase E2 component (dihydrolipoamide succinyltransferase)
MATNVVMPQMGESIAEGTIVRWIKKVGDAVDRDEPLFEISTDKVDAEIPSPDAGVLTEIKVKEGETVPVNAVVAVIGSASSASATAPDGATAATDAASARPADAAAAPGTSAMPEAAAGQPETGDHEPDAGGRQRTSPLVRRIAREHNVDISRISGTGISGRVTKQDILGFIDNARPDPGPVASEKRARAATPAAQGHVPTFKPGERVEIVPMTIMRRKIAEHMVMSAHTSPHVYSVYEVDFHRLSQLRERKKAEYEQNGAKLSFTALVAKATVDAIRAFPFTNASIDGDNIVYRKDINLGIAVALDHGLIVPVIRNADEKNLLGLSRAIDDLATRARTKKLSPDEVQGGTFTLTNPGIFGAVYGLPLINQPQVAILGVGAIEKRAVVIDDAIAIHPTCHLSLGYDHRLIDGADAGRFLSYLKERLENFDTSWM